MEPAPPELGAGRGRGGATGEGWAEPPLSPLYRENTEVKSLTAESAVQALSLRVLLREEQVPKRNEGLGCAQRCAFSSQMDENRETQRVQFSNWPEFRQLTRSKARISDSKAELFPPNARTVIQAVTHCHRHYRSIRTRSLSKDHIVSCVWTKGATVHRPRASPTHTEPSGRETCFVTSRTKHGQNAPSIHPPLVPDTRMLDPKASVDPRPRPRPRLDQSDPLARWEFNSTFTQHLAGVPSELDVRGTLDIALVCHTPSSSFRLHHRHLDPENRTAIQPAAYFTKSQGRAHVSTYCHRLLSHYLSSAESFLQGQCDP